MGLASRLLRGRPDPGAVGEAVGDAVTALPGVTGHSITYGPRRYAGGSLHGVVDVADAGTFRTVLVTSGRVLREILGDDSQRVIVYLAGRIPDGAAVTPDAFGLSPRPLGRELLAWIDDGPTGPGPGPVVKA